MSAYHLHYFKSNLSNATNSGVARGRGGASESTRPEAQAFGGTTAQFLQSFLTCF